MSKRTEDSWDLAAARILARLSEEEGIEFVSSRGVASLTSPLSAYLLRLTEAGAADRADALADWLCEQQEVADLYADDAQIETLLREEWDPAAGTKRAEPAASVGGPNSRNEELEQMLFQDPDSVELYLLYGDWLKEQGDPLGELMARQAVLAVEPTPENQQAAEKHLREHQSYLLGRLSEAPQAVRLEWHMGFLRAARLWTPAPGQLAARGDEVLSWLLELPTARFLRELWLGPFDHQGADQYAEMVQVLLAAERPALRDLSIGVAEFETDTSQTDAGDLSGLAQALPELRRLEVRAGQLELGSAPLELPWLEELVLQIQNWTPGNLDTLATARFPFLERLELSSAGPLEEEGLRALAQLLAGEGLPVLEGLCLRLPAVSGAALELLINAPLLERLDELDLSGGGVDERAAMLLAEHAGRLSQLQRLDLRDNQLGGDALHRLEQSCPEVLVGARD